MKLDRLLVYAFILQGDFFTIVKPVVDKVVTPLRNSSVKMSSMVRRAGQMVHTAVTVTCAISPLVSKVYDRFVDPS
jgi:hypothetical protein